jgi:hypothetical protein
MLKLMLETLTMGWYGLIDLAQHTDQWRDLVGKTRTVTSRQGNNEEQAHTRNKGTNEHDWKETAIFLETNLRMANLGRNM